MLNTSILPSAFVKQLEFSKEDLQASVATGLIQRIDNHKEHFAIAPCFMQDPGSGVMEEITNSVMGKWNNKLKAYVVYAENIRNYDGSAGMNEDHRWLHVDTTATYYVYTPKVGQRIRGEIKKVGVKAAICIVFDVFTVTVLARDETELASWSVGDELNLEVCSFQHRRKGPIIRARSIAKSGSISAFNRKRKKYFDSEPDFNETEDCDPESAKGLSSTQTEVEFPFQVHPEQDSDSPPVKKKKKSKKHKHKQEIDTEPDDQGFEDIDAGPPEETWLNESVQSEPLDDKKSSKKKKKKSSKRSE